MTKITRSGAWNIGWSSSATSSGTVTVYRHLSACFSSVTWGNVTAGIRFLHISLLLTLMINFVQNGWKKKKDIRQTLPSLWGINKDFELSWIESSGQRGWWKWTWWIATATTCQVRVTRVTVRYPQCEGSHKRRATTDEHTNVAKLQQTKQTIFLPRSSFRAATREDKIKVDEAGLTPIHEDCAAFLQLMLRAVSE